MTTIAVTGGRSYRLRSIVWRVLNQIHAESTITLLVHGSATGLDALAADWAYSHNVAHTGAKYAAKWRVNGKIDYSAGPRRNRAMLDAEHPWALVAFPGGTGTADCVKAAKERSIPIIRVVE